MVIREKHENPLDTEEQQERESCRFCSAGKETWGRTEKDVRSREVSSYNRLSVRLPMPSLLCMPSPPPSYVGLLLLRSVPRNVLFLPFRSRCTVAFGLCIIITITASSSWLVVEKPPLGIFSLSFSIRFHSLSRFRQEARDEKEKQGWHSWARVCALIKFLA